MAGVTEIVINFVIQTAVLVPVLWIVGKNVANPKDVKFTDSIWIIVLGNVIATVLSFAFGNMFGAAVMLGLINMVIWLLLVRYFFDTSIIKAAIISVIAMIVFVVVMVILGVLGLGLLVSLI